MAANSHNPPCSKGCGFYGSTATANMCSKCYKDFLTLREERLRLPPIKVGKPKTLSSSSLVGTDDHDDTSKRSTESERDTSKTNKEKNRCQWCKKRVGLTGFECRCGGMFCGSHRYPEEHSCGFDFKSFGRALLASQNPLCNGDKLLERA